MPSTRLRQARRLGRRRSISAYEKCLGVFDPENAAPAANGADTGDILSFGMSQIEADINRAFGASDLSFSTMANGVNHPGQAGPMAARISRAECGRLRDGPRAGRIFRFLSEKVLVGSPGANADGFRVRYFFRARRGSSIRLTSRRSKYAGRIRGRFRICSIRPIPTSRAFLAAHGSAS